MIEIKNLTKTYGNSTVKAIEDVNLTVNSGEIFGFLGPNGAGKSTTIKCMTGILPFTDGSIEICGINAKESPVEAKRKIGFVPDEHLIYDSLRGAEYVNFIANIFGVNSADCKSRMEKYAEIFGLKDKMKDFISTYSHGMKQKVALIAALVHDPEVLVLDEPMTGLDPEATYNLKLIMKERAEQGKVVFFSSHVLDVVEKICTKVAIIEKGHIIAVFDVDDLKNKQNDMSLEEFFLKVTKQEADHDRI